MDINNKQVAENIYALAKLKNKKIQELEEVADMSIGYLSRFLKGSIALPSLTSIFKIAEELGVSVDQLIKNDYVKMNTEVMIKNQFIQMLDRKTKDMDIHWIKLDLGNIEDDLFIQFVQQLHIKKSEYGFKLDALDYNGLHLSSCKGIYCTKYLQSKAMIVSLDYYSETGIRSTVYELYILKNLTVINLCDSESDKNRYLENLQSLYLDIETTIYRERTGDDVLDFLTDLMKGGADYGR